MCINIQDLCIVNYCHPSCTPLKNIMRLPRDEAFALAAAMAAENPETTAFYRFADFENYYPRRLQTDALLHARFLELGGKPVEDHPLSFVLQGSRFLDGWFDHGFVTRVPLSQIPSEAVSFTYGDSMSVLQREGAFTMLTKEMLVQTISAYDGTLDAYFSAIADTFHYIEVQVWNDACLGL